MLYRRSAAGTKTLSKKREGTTLLHRVEIPGQTASAKREFLFFVRRFFSADSAFFAAHLWNEDNPSHETQRKQSAKEIRILCASAVSPLLVAAVPRCVSVLLMPRLLSFCEGFSPRTLSSLRHTYARAYSIVRV